MHLSPDDVRRFAAWSADRNPLHVDAEYARATHFGRPVVHGVLAVLDACREAVESQAWDGAPVRALDIEFRTAVFAGDEHEVRSREEADALIVEAGPAAAPVLTIRAERGRPGGDAAAAGVPFETGGEAPDLRETPALRTLRELQGGVTTRGVYPVVPDPGAPAPRCLSPTQVRVLALCSYLTGMELPGLRSLFTRIQLRFHGDAGERPGLRYQARAARFDAEFRMLETDLEVWADDGRLVATGRLSSYVPFSPARTDPDLLAARLSPEAARLEGKVALVVGGSRGLGADITTVLALAGCHVYASARQDDAARREWHARLAERGAAVEFLQGDAADPHWCAAALQAIRAAHGRLDLLVLNACAPPAHMRVTAGTAAAREQYVRDNLRLVETPLAACAAALEESGGSLVYLSSSYVQDPPPGFAHYVAVKQAGEGLVRTLVRESPHLHALLARPPALQTRWNDTPAGVLGTIPSDHAASHLVNRLAGWRAGAVDVLAEFPPFVDPAEAPSRASLTLRVSATFTVDPLVPALDGWMRALELDGRVEAAPYGQVLQSLLDPSSVLNAPGPGIAAVFVRAADWLRELSDDRVADARFVESHLAGMVAELGRAVRAHRALTASDTVLVVCPSAGAPDHHAAALLQAEEALVAALQGIAGLQVLTATAWHDAYDVDAGAVHDPLRDEIAHIPFTDGYLEVLATIVARRVYRRLAPVRKVVVVDCDNTLWCGVVGEVGAEGIEIREEHRALHRKLAELAAAGVLVALCSKNEEADVWRVFETRDDMLLRREQVVAAAINWLPKSQNLRSLAARLNLGIDSLVFIDDNPVECAEVRAGCLEVLTIEWPHEPAAAWRLLQHIWEFDIVGATKEDARRTEMYREELRRQDLRAAAQSFGEFIESLQLEVDSRPLADEDLKRAAQLTLRTNQFNFTTIRRSEADLQALVAGGRHDIRTVRVRDRFGDYGLVGLVIVEGSDETWRLDTCLLSCRVLGRGVEHRIFADLGRRAGDAGAGTVTLRIDATPRNTPARAFLDAAVAAEWRRPDADGVACAVPSEVLAAVRFEPAAGEVIVEDERSSRTTAAPVEASRVRRREQQIAEACRGVGHGAVSATTGPAPDASSPSRHPANVSDPDHACEAIVRGAFAEALRVPVARIIEVDRLEALGCSSLKIVEITVALRAQFPALPPTLLFEHRTVSQIVAEIDRLTANDRRPGPASATISPARTRQDADRRPGPAAGLDSARRGPGTDDVRAGDIAVVGIGVRCAGADSLDELWALLRDGRSAVREVPADRRWFLHPLADTRPHWAGLLDDPSRFDADLFGVSPREADYLDPQLRLFLEVAWHALEDAGCGGADLDPGTGVFAGVMYGDYGPDANAAAKRAGLPYRCWEGFSLANRLSQLLGLHGPSLAVDTACSSSGTALHLACGALRNGDCGVAIVGGVNLILDPDRFGSLGRLGILSARGRCEPFGADADGTVLGEGAGVVVLRPLAEAVRRGDRIYGVIKGTGVSTGSGTVGFTAPNPQAQAEAIRRGLQAAGVDPRTVSYIETHGTGTALGDPIEVRGLTLGYGTDALRDPSLDLPHRCTIGSIKPNVGHLEAGAGVVALIKVLLQLHHRTLVPSITSAAPNPQIPFGDGSFAVQRTLAAWDPLVAQAGGERLPLPRRAGLSSFGVGGANAHVIVEEAPAMAAPAAAVRVRPLHLVTVSGPDEDALRRQAARVSRFLAQPHEAAPGDVCHSLNTGRRHFAHRVAAVGATGAELADALTAAAGAVAAPERGEAARAVPRIAFLFTGQGSQYAGMGRALYEAHPVFRAAIDRCAATLDPRLPRPLVRLLHAGEGSADAALLNQTGCTQPALFAIQYALAQLWHSWGVRPDVVLGHSVGELAAMCVAGGLELDEALTLVAARGGLMQALPAGGSMLSAMAGETPVLAAMAGFETLVSIAAINAPDQTVVSGDAAAIAAIAARLAAAGIRTKPLLVSHAFHSPLMAPMLADYERVVRDIRFDVPAVPIVSCVEPGSDRVAEMMTGSAYWLRQVRDPVRFADGIRAIETRGIDVCIEIGPHPVLLAAGRQCVSDGARIAWLPSLRREADEWRTLLGSLAGLYGRGAAIAWDAFDAPFGYRRVPTPGYAFAPISYWLAPADRRAGNVSAAGAPGQERTAAAGAAGDAAGSHDTARRPGVYQLAWRRDDREAMPGPVGSRPDHWVVLADRRGLGVELARALAEAGAPATLVFPGPAFQAVGPHRYEVNPSSRRDLARVLAAVASDTGARPGVVHLWSLDAARTEALTVEALDAAIARGAANAVHVIQALVNGGPSGGMLWLVTSGAVHVEDDAPSRPPAIAQAPIWGLGRTMALEHPDAWGGLIDVAQVDAAGARALAAELMSATIEDQVALTPGGRYVARLTVVRGFDAAAPTAATEGMAPAIRPDGVYLVVGGLGALGLHVAGWLAARGARHLILTGRRGVAGSEGRDAIAALEAAGVRVSVIAADVSRPQQVDALLARVVAGPVPLRGVVHAAGVDAPMPLAGMHAADVNQALAAKMIGGWLLHDRTRDLDLDLFIAFSSLASVLGSQGRAHYAAANAFLDALAVERRRLGLPVTVVNWGPWAGGGMATGDELQQFERIGQRGLEPGQALQTLGAVVRAGLTQAIVADIDWDRFAPVYEARRRRPAIAGVTEAMTPARAAGAAGRHAAVSSWADRLASLTAAARESALAALVRQEVAETLGFGSAERVSLGRSFYEMGMDSLMMADLVGRLNARMGAPCGALVFNHPDVRSLAARLVERLPTASAPAGGTGGRPPEPEPLAAAGRLVSEMGHLPSLPGAGGGTGVAGTRAGLAPHAGVATATADPEPLAGALEPDPEVLAFHAAAWPARDLALSVARWQWMFLDSARRLGVAPRVWLHREDGVIVGHMGSIPVQLQIGGTTHRTGWLVETMVLESYRDRAIGSRLMIEARDDQPFSLSLGQSAEMREIQFRLGWVQVGPMQTAYLPIRPEVVLQGKLPAPAAWAAGIGMRASSAVRSLWRPRGTFRVGEIARFGEAHDRLWGDVRGDLPCAVVRDASYLNWKYVDRPGQEFLRQEIREGEVLRAVAVWTIREPRGRYHYRRAYLVDLVAPLGDRPALEQVVAAACAHAADTGVDALGCYHMSPRLTAALRACGFHLRDPRRFLLVDPGHLGGEALQRVLDGENWFVMQGDSDIDRPW